MGKHRFDVYNLFLEADKCNQSEFVAADIEYGQFADFIDGRKNGFQFRPVGEPVVFDDPCKGFSACGY